jgi:multicomponent Na+:H+ antiporter subunit C
VTISTIVLATGLMLILIGVWGMLTHRDILRIIIGFSLMGTGSHIVIATVVAIGRLLSMPLSADASIVDPPSRCNGTLSGCMRLSFAIRRQQETLPIDAFTD